MDEEEAGEVDKTGLVGSQNQPRPDLLALCVEATKTGLDGF